MIMQKIAWFLWFLFFPVVVTIIATLARQLYPWQNTISPLWAEIAVIAVVGLIIGRAYGGKRQ
jgi:hypothetical protein